MAASYSVVLEQANYSAGDRALALALIKSSCPEIVSPVEYPVCVTHGRVSRQPAPVRAGLSSWLNLFVTNPWRKQRVARLILRRIHRFRVALSIWETLIRHPDKISGCEKLIRANRMRCRGFVEGGGMGPRTLEAAHTCKRLWLPVRASVLAPAAHRPSASSGTPLKIHDRARVGSPSSALQTTIVVQ